MASRPTSISLISNALTLEETPEGVMFEVFGDFQWDAPHDRRLYHDRACAVANFNGRGVSMECDTVMRIYRPSGPELAPAEIIRRVWAD